MNFLFMNKRDGIAYASVAATGTGTAVRRVILTLERSEESVIPTFSSYSPSLPI